jgi:hypothetical protein
MGNVQVSRYSVNDILKNGNPNAPFYPFTDPQSLELYQLFRETRKNQDRDVTKYEKKFGANGLQLREIGYYHGEIIAFRFLDSHRPFIFFEYRNVDYKRIMELLKRSHRNQSKNSSSKYNPIPEELTISYLHKKDSDIYWVTDVFYADGETLIEGFSNLRISG